MWLNAMASGKGIYQKDYPIGIVTEKNMDIKNYCRVVFGLYVEAHDEPNITNNKAPRTHEFISLVSTVNIQGTHTFFF